MTPTMDRCRPAGMVARPSLERRLDRLAPVAVLQALPGHGKSTLARAWAERQKDRGALVMWWDATPELDRPAVVRHALAEALGASERSSVVLVVDGAHHLGPQACEALCQTVLTHPRLHLVACADGAQHVTVQAGRHRLETSVIGSSELTVTAIELPLFARAWGHDLTAAEAADLHERVGGWLLPARLVLDESDRTAGAWRTEPAEEFVRREVLPIVTERLDLDLVGRLALGPHVRLDLAAELVGMRRDRAQAVLDDLVATGVLERAPAPGPPDRWHLPALLGRVLREEREGRDDARWHAAVARSLARERRPDLLANLLDHARRGTDWELLTDLWRMHAFRLLSELPAATVAAFSGLPSTVVEETPSLQIPVAMADALAARPEDVDARTALRELAAASRRALVARALPEDPAARSVAVTAALVALRSAGRLDDALRLARAYDRERRRPRAERVARPPDPTAWFLSTWGWTLAQRGDLVRALDVSIRAFEAATEPDGSEVITAHVAALVALLHTQIGTTEDGRRWLEVVDRADAERPAPARVCRALLALDRLDVGAADVERGAGSARVDDEAWPFVVPAISRRAVLAGDEPAALDQLRELELAQGSTMHHDGLAARFLDRAHADLLLALGEVDRTRTLLDQRPADAPWLRVPQARLAAMTGDHERAARLASSGVWEVGVATRDTAELLMLAAGAHVARGDDAAALEAFDRGRVLAAGIGTLEPYVGLPADVRDHLAELSGNPLGPSARAALSRVTGPYPTAASSVALSPRESEVLHLMTEHATAADVARSLTVSVNTVKKQQVSIYAKLGVHGRAPAIARARALGLLPEVSRRGGD